MTRSIIRFELVTLALSVAGCAATNQLHSELNYRQLVADTELIGEAGIGVLTPSAPTGQESDKQALGDALGQTLESDFPDAQVVPLPALLSGVNQAGLARTYAAMLAEYESTGILERDQLQAIGEAAGARYLAKFNLGDFQQTTAKRLDIAGIRFLNTRTAAIRVHLEIWDSWFGAIVWQGNEELVFAQEGVRERPISFQQVANFASQRLVAKVGESGRESLDEESPALADTNPAGSSAGSCEKGPVPLVALAAGVQ